MSELVMVQIPVTKAAAKLLGNAARKERVGRLVSDLIHPESPADDPLALIIAEIKSAARADGLTDSEIDTELAAYNAENHL